jgi:hypothetical protein
MSLEAIFIKTHEKCSQNIDSYIKTISLDALFGLDAV